MSGTRCRGPIAHPPSHAEEYEGDEPELRASERHQQRPPRHAVNARDRQRHEDEQRRRIDEQPARLAEGHACGVKGLRVEHERPTHGAETCPRPYRYGGSNSEPVIAALYYPST